MAGTIIEFDVVGEPATQGSKIEHVIRGKGGKPVIKNGRALTTIREDNPRLAVWRQEVAHAASVAYTGPLFIGAVRLTLDFQRPRPKNHYGTGRNAGTLKASAPKYPTGRPDTIKMARAVEDALTGVVYVDDSQAVAHLLTKAYGRFGVHVMVESLDGLTLESEEETDNPAKAERKNDA